MTSCSRIAAGIGRALIGGLLVAAGTVARAGDTTNDGAFQIAKKRSVEFFEAVKNGDIEAKFIPRNSSEGQLLVTNKSDQPLTVKLPEAFAAVPVLAQAANNNAPANGTHKSYNNNNNNQTQALGGGLGTGGGIGGGIGGAFDVAPEKVTKFKVETVCLEHGKKEPSPRITYEIHPIERYTSDANVQELCKLLGSGQIGQHATQAAAWHLANHMTWEQLVDKRIHHLIGGDENYFSKDDILAAMQITDRAMKAAEARNNDTTNSKSSSMSASADVTRR